jgi:hypothetical protein
MAYGNPRRLYVLAFADGVLKAGITSRSDARLYEHARRAPISQHFVSDFVSGIEAERALLSRLCRIGTCYRGREWFVGVAFADASQIAQQVAGEFPNPNPASAAHLLRTERVNLSFSDSELAVLDAYCKLVGKSRSAAARELAVSEVVRLSHAADSSMRP